MYKKSINDSLEHYGVLGMHWGVTRGKVSSAISNKKASNQKLLAAERSKKYTSNKTNKLTKERDKYQQKESKRKKTIHTVATAGGKPLHKNSAPVKIAKVAVAIPSAISLTMNNQAKRDTNTKIKAQKVKDAKAQASNSLKYRTETKVRSIPKKDKIIGAALVGSAIAAIGVVKYPQVAAAVRSKQVDMRWDKAISKGATVKTAQVVTRLAIGG